MVRLMQPSDFGVVRTLIPLAFADLFTRETGQRQTLPRRSEAELASYLDSSPGGCFVAVRNGRITGCGFCHTWGDVGWIGPLAVHPGFQGNGIGKKLLAEGLAYLAGTGARTIGLETMPQTVYNLGLYLRQGFVPGNLRLRYGKDLGLLPLEAGSLPPADQATAAAMLPEVTRISDAIEPGLDYSREFMMTYRYGLGQALFWPEGEKLNGFCLYQYLIPRERAIIKVMAVAPGPGSEVRFRRYLRELESHLRARGVNYLTVPVYGEYSGVCRWLLEEGYVINNAGVRLFRQQKDLPPEDRSEIVHLSQWSG